MKTKYNFYRSKRLVTKGANQKIYSELRTLIWLYLDEQIDSNEEMDYLQIFTFERKGNSLIIKHEQEEPKRKREYKALWFSEYESILNLKVYIIDNVAYSTMLLVDEY